ncbi:hypothetical protein ACXIUT_16460 [Achromobacter denitrificans]
MALLKLATPTSEFQLEIGTEKHTTGAHISLHAGGDNLLESKAVYEEYS